MKALKTLMLATTVLAFPACSQADVSTTDRETIEKIVYEYLMENPEVIFEVQAAYEVKQDQDSINSAKMSIYSDKRDIVIGPDDAKVTIVEFFDYNCTFCKRSTDWLIETIEKHPNDVRVIFKELPILDGRTKRDGTKVISRKAAKAALAANKQGKYLEMHTALMAAPGLNDARLDEIAASIGLDVKKMRADMQDPEIAEYIEDTMILGQRLRPMTGTPFFMIGDEFLAGADVQRLEQMLQTALKP